MVTGSRLKKSKSKKRSSPSDLLSDEKAPTESQAEVLKFIKLRYEQTGVSPSFREIQAHFGYKAVGTVQDHVKGLLEKGALERSESGAGRRARGLIPRGFKAEATRRLPIYGEIAAGPTRDSAQLELGSLVVSGDFAKDHCFALRVVGDSMVEAGIFEGDHLVVDRSVRVRSGDIVVALLNGETTVKRYVQKTDGTYLVPENARFKPIRVEGMSLEIQGKVVGLQRKL